MSLMNVSLNVVAYADQSGTSNPLVKYADLRWSLLGLPSDLARTVPINLSPGETTVVMTTERSLSFNTSTSFDIFPIVGTSDVQLIGNFGQRTPRNVGDDTTEWDLAVSNGLVTLTYTTTGTSPSFGSMVAGDGITLDLGFNTLNQGDFKIVKVGADYVQFVNRLATAETVTSTVLYIYSSAPVQIGDILDLTSSAFVYPNHGEFTITRVTGDFIQFTNPNAIAETGITNVAGSALNIYPEAYQWMLMAVDRKILVNLNNDTGSGVVVEPVAPGNIVQTPGLFLKRGKVFKVELTNNGFDIVNGTLFLAQ